MKTVTILFIFSFQVIFLFAQRSNDQDIQDSVIGWWRNNRFDHLKTQTDPIGKKKEAILNDFVKWVKTSYTPVGGIGTSSRYIGKKGYGVQFLVWNVSHDKQWTEPNGNFKPIAEENTRFDVAVNQLYGAYPISFINTGNEFYFVIEPDGYAVGEQSKANGKNADPRIHPNTYKYITRMNEWCTVYLAPNNKLPWTPVMKAELLQKAEEGLQKVLDDKKKEVASQWSDTKTQNEVIEKFKTETIEKYRNNIHTLQQKHSGSLSEPAIVRSMQPNMYSFETDPDIFTIDRFENNLKHSYQVFKLDAATVAKMNEATPQWVAVAFPFETKEQGNQLYEMFTAMSQNINYDYIYNYFYSPEKIANINYTAANADQLNARLNTYRNTSSKNKILVTKKMSGLPANVILFDDFSQDATGNKPGGWYYNSYGKANLVSNLAGEKGHWLKLGYNSQLTSTTITALPQDFSLEFDLATDPFTDRWGASLAVHLSGNKKGADGSTYSSGIDMTITAGNQDALNAAHDYRGELKVVLINKPTKMDYNEQGGYFTYAQPVFTSAQRKVHIKIEKKDQSMKVYLNEKQVASSAKDFKTLYGKNCGDCNIPSIVYDQLSIKNTTNDAEAVGCYITNVRILKL